MCAQPRTTFTMESELKQQPGTLTRNQPQKAEVPPNSNSRSKNNHALEGESNRAAGKHATTLQGWVRAWCGNSSETGPLEKEGTRRDTGTHPKNSDRAKVTQNRSSRSHPTWRRRQRNPPPRRVSPKNLRIGDHRIHGTSASNIP